MNIRFCCLLAWLLTWAWHGVCLADDYSEWFNAASDAYAEQDYGRAVVLFNKAKNVNPDKATMLDFNIGSSLYKWGQYIAAYQAFESASADPRYYVLSHINMALCAAKLNDRGLVSKHLLIAAPLVQSERYQQQIKSIADKFDLQIRTGTESTIVRSINLSVGRQNHINQQLLDQNDINLPTQTQPTNAYYVSSAINVRYLRSDFFDLNLLVQDLAYQTRHREIRKNNYRFINLGSEVRFRASDSQWSAALSGQHFQLSDSVFQNHVILRLKASYLSKHWQAGAYYQYRAIYALDNQYDYLQGEEHKTGVLWQGRYRRWKPSLEIAVADNRRDDDYADINGQLVLQQSYSPDVLQIGTSMQYDVSDALKLQLGYDFRRDQYPIVQQSERYNHRRSASYSAVYAFAKAWSASLSYQDIRQTSTDPQYRFDSRIVLFAVAYAW